MAIQWWPNRDDFIRETPHRNFSSSEIARKLLEFHGWSQFWENMLPPAKICKLCVLFDKFQPRLRVNFRRNWQKLFDISHYIGSEYRRIAQASSIMVPNAINMIRRRIQRKHQHQSLSMARDHIVRRARRRRRARRWFASARGISRYFDRADSIVSGNHATHCVLIDIVPAKHDILQDWLSLRSGIQEIRHAMEDTHTNVQWSYPIHNTYSAWRTANPIYYYLQVYPRRLYSILQPCSS
jgi:hypothetical protein